MDGENIADDIAGDAGGVPGVEELRMVRAIAGMALMEAARCGEYRATFRGFRVEARRQCPAGAGARIDVRLCVSLGQAVVEHGLLATIDTCAVEPKS